MSKPPQVAFTKLFEEDLTYDVASRKTKAKKIITVIKNEFKKPKELSVLDLGSSMGYISEFLSPHFKKVVGVDVDEEAIKKAKKRVKAKNVTFLLSKEKKLPFKANTFDVVVFNQVYEHVQSPESMLKEIKRVMKPIGICFFGARNKYGVFDGHYDVPFISWVPKDVANIYVQMFLQKKEYDINLYSYRKLKKLVSDFRLTDYTLEVIKHPKKYSVNDQVPEGTLKHRVLILVSSLLYPFIPNYIWVLRKK